MVTRRTPRFKGGGTQSEAIQAQRGSGAQPVTKEPTSVPSIAQAPTFGTTGGVSPGQIAFGGESFDIRDQGQAQRAESFRVRDERSRGGQRELLGTLGGREFVIGDFSGATRAPDTQPRTFQAGPGITARPSQVASSVRGAAPSQPIGAETARVTAKQQQEQQTEQKVSEAREKALAEFESASTEQFREKIQVPETLAQLRSQITQIAKRGGSEEEKRLQINTIRKNMERVKKGLPPTLQIRRMKDPTTRSGFRFEEVNQLGDPRGGFEQSEQFKQFQQEEARLREAGLGAAEMAARGATRLSSGAITMGEDEQASRARAEQVAKLSGLPIEAVDRQADGSYKIRGMDIELDPQKRAEQKMEAQRQDALSGINKQFRQEQEQIKRSHGLIRGGLSPAGKAALASSMRNQAEATEKVDKQVQNAREETLLAEAQRQSQLEQQSADPSKQMALAKNQAMLERIQTKMQETGMDFVGAQALVQKEINAIGDDPTVETAFDAFSQLQKAGQVKPETALQSAISLPGVEGNVTNAQKVLKAAGFDDATIKNQLTEYRKNVLGLSDESNQMAGWGDEIAMFKEGRGDFLQAGEMMKKIKSQSGVAAMLAVGEDLLASPDLSEQNRNVIQSIFDDAEAEGLIKRKRQAKALGKAVPAEAAALGVTTAGGARADMTGPAPAEDTPQMATARSFLDAFNEGTISYEDALSRIGSQKFNAPVRNAFAQLVSEQGGKRVFGRDSNTISDIKSQIKSLKDLKESGDFESISGALRLGLKGGRKGAAQSQMSSILASGTLDALAGAKSRGITFGALSEGEMGVVRASASRLAGMAETDPQTGRLIRLNATEEQVADAIDDLVGNLERSIEEKTGQPLEREPAAPAASPQQSDFMAKFNAQTPEVQAQLRANPRFSQFFQ